MNPNQEQEGCYAWSAYQCSMRETGFPSMAVAFCQKNMSTKVWGTRFLHAAQDPVIQILLQTDHNWPEQLRTSRIQGMEKLVAPQKGEIPQGLSPLLRHFHATMFQEMPNCRRSSNALSASWMDQIRPNFLEMTGFGPV